MITSKNIHTVGFRDTLSRGLPKAADNLLSIQKYVLNKSYSKDTSILRSVLNSKPYSVDVTDTSASLRINYVAQIRFLDMKYNADGTKKKRRTPIYNKYVWGFLMGYTYNLLRQGLFAETQRRLPHVTINVKI